MWKNDPKCSHLHEPDFYENPSEWFDWFHDCASGTSETPEPPEPPEPPCTKRRWRDASGKCWETICTPDGPEIRPCFTRPLPPIRGGTQIVAMRLTGDGYLVQIATKSGTKVGKIAHGKVKLSQLASAMLNRSKLPTAEVRKIPSTFWAKQKKVVVKKSP